jgi:hypothetical protein
MTHSIALGLEDEVTDFIQSDPGRTVDVDIYRCDPPMVEAVSGWLDQQDVIPTGAHRETFTPGGRVATLRKAS